MPEQTEIVVRFTKAKGYRWGAVAVGTPYAANGETVQLAFDALLVQMACAALDAVKTEEARRG